MLIRLRGLGTSIQRRSSACSQQPPAGPTARAFQSFYIQLKLRVTGLPYLLEVEGLDTQGSQPGRALGESVPVILEMDSYHWSKGIRYHIFDTRFGTEFHMSTFKA